MKKLAIDVVLFPSEQMMNEAIFINQKILQEEDRKIILNKENCFPHISLLMGCIDVAHLYEANIILDKIGSLFTSFHLQIEASKTDSMPDDKPVTVLNIRKDHWLQSLHEKTIEGLLPFLTFDATPDMLDGNPADIQNTTLHVINNFLKNSSFDNFSPHITVGLGAYPSINYQSFFTASTLALCHLGNHCTCSKILHSVTLWER